MMDSCCTGRFLPAFPGRRNVVWRQHSLVVALSDVTMGSIWDGKSLLCGNQYHNGGWCLRKPFISQASAWYLFPHLFDHLTQRKTCFFSAPGFVISPFQEDEANISMKVWEFGSRTACCVQKGLVSLWHQQNQNYKVYSLELAPMAVKIKLSI